MGQGIGTLPCQSMGISAKATTSSADKTEHLNTGLSRKVLDLGNVNESPLNQPQVLEPSLLGSTPLCLKASLKTPLSSVQTWAQCKATGLWVTGLERD